MSKSKSALFFAKQSGGDVADTTETINATIERAQEIYYKLVNGKLPTTVSYIDYDSPDQPGFESDIAPRFGYPAPDNDLVRDAVQWMSEQNMVYFDRKEEEGRETRGSGGQPYPMRFSCTVTVR